MDWEAAQIRADAYTVATLEAWKKDAVGALRDIKRREREESVALVEREFARSADSPRKAAVFAAAAALSPKEVEDTIKEADRLWVSRPASPHPRDAV